MNNNQLQDLVLDWAEEKGLLKPENALAQLAKVVEELGELSGGILKKKEDVIIDSLGDLQVTVILLTEQLGYNYDACLEKAYNVIKDRQGKLIDGVFVKTEDLTK